MLSMLYINFPTDLNIFEREKDMNMLKCLYTFRNDIRWKQEVYILWMKHVTLKCEILTKYITYLRYALTLYIFWYLHNLQSTRFLFWQLRFFPSFSLFLLLSIVKSGEIGSFPKRWFVSRVVSSVSFSKSTSIIWSLGKLRSTIN